MIFHADAMKELFRVVLLEAKKKFRFHLHNFCILGNHFHLIIQPQARANLSAIMQWIMSVFAQRWNRHHGLRGHVWGERFFSRIIGSLARSSHDEIVDRAAELTDLA
jgi:putative transposase